MITMGSNELSSIESLFSGLLELINFHNIRKKK